MCGHRHRHRETPRAGVCGDIPSAPHNRVTPAHQKTVSGVYGGCGIVSAACEIVQLPKRKIVAAVVDFKKQAVISLGGVDGPQDVNISDILDVASRVFRGEPDIHNFGVAPVFWVHFSIGASHELLVRSYGAEGSARERWRLGARDLDSRDVRERKNWQAQQRRACED